MIARFSRVVVELTGERIDLEVVCLPSPKGRVCCSELSDVVFRNVVSSHKSGEEGILMRGFLAVAVLVCSRIFLLVVLVIAMFGLSVNSVNVGVYCRNCVKGIVT